MDDRLVYEILSVVEEIPEGTVASYGQIARLIGRENHSRLVGKVLSVAEFYGDYPCHRVVNHAGRLAPHFSEQRERLLAEGVEFSKNGHVNMKKSRWNVELGIDHSVHDGDPLGKGNAVAGDGERKEIPTIL